MAVESNVPRSCQEHEMELLKLSEFIKDTENLLEGFLKSLSGQTLKQKVGVWLINDCGFSLLYLDRYCNSYTIPIIIFCSCVLCSS